MLMSVQPRSWPEPAPEIVAAVRAAYRRREPPLPVTVRDRLGELFPDAEFAPGFGVRGRPGWSPGRLALVTVLQMAENLTDRQAADAVRDKIWKYALGLDLDDLTPQARRAYAIDRELTKGVVITHVKPVSPAGDANLAGATALRASGLIREER